MDTKDPIIITDAEWREIMEVPEVREGWGLESGDEVAFFKSNVYGVKFYFVSGGPEYCGDLYLLQGDGLEAPMALIRKSGALEMIRNS